MTIKDLSEKASMNYNTARKYFIALKEEGLAESPENDLVPILHEISRLSSEGKTVKQAIASIKQRGVSFESDDVASIKSEIRELKKQVSTLSDLLQLELSKQKELPEKSGFWYHLKAAFRSLFKRK